MPADVMDEEWLLSAEQICSLLKAIRGNMGGHHSVYPFMRTVADLALRPSEAHVLRVSDVVLSEGGEASLTARHKGAERKVPLQSQIVEFLREWINEAGLQEGELLFPGVHDRPLMASTYMRIWEQAQEAALPRDELYTWRLGEPVTILLESCLVMWLKMGISPVTVAEWAGVSPKWLALRYPYCFRTEEAEAGSEHLTKATALPGSLSS
ncbi:tyrosine-type recombinase/integrase [Streptomyces monomycini]|uniref:tyrosine-type recombinase/integrase n=1 Tax=Streptomyces monomycini TaxID=371720 RepID=UPI0004A9F515|nr:tyrosine-type recombinase/integrase [Streptomyces monomycini]